MSPRLVLIGAVVTLLTVIAAIVAVLERPGPETVGTDGAPAFPLLRARPDAIARMVVADGAGSVTLARGTDGDWTVVERDGYPAAAERVRRLVGDLADMRLVEPKTAKPDRFARLDVDDPQGPDARARRVRLDTAAGEPLAETILGRRVYAYTGGRESGTYIRRADDERAWLASGAITIEAAPAGWLAPTIFAIPTEAIHRVRVMPADGDAYEVVRRPDGAADSPDAAFTLSPLPEGRTADAAALSRLVSAVAAPTLDDVRPADGMDLPDRATRIEVEAADGLRLTVRLATVEDAPWLVVAVADPGGGGMDAPSDRLDRWAFRLSSQAADRLAPAVESLLTPETPADPGR